MFIHSFVCVLGGPAGVAANLLKRGRGFSPTKLFMEKPGDFHSYSAVTIIACVSPEVCEQVCP